MQFTSSLNLQQESIPVCAVSGSEARDPLHVHHTGRCSCMYHKPCRPNWPLRLRRRGLEEERRKEEMDGWMEGTDQKLLEKLQEPQETNGKIGWEGGGCGGTLAAFRPPKVFLLCFSSLPLRFSLPLRWRLSVAMVTAEEEAIPEERRRCQRGRLWHEELLSNFDKVCWPSKIARIIYFYLFSRSILQRRLCRVCTPHLIMT